jgi:hypothetical protein
MEKAELLALLVREHLRDGFKAFGIEGTEHFIKTNMTETPALQQKMLEEYNNIISEYINKE